MKEKITGHKSLLQTLVFATLACASANATVTTPWGPAGRAEDWSWSSDLRLQMNVAWDQKPSSVRSQNPTEWGRLDWRNTWEHDEEPFDVALWGHVGPERDPQTKHVYWQWDEARLTWRHQPAISVGLLRDPVVAFDENEWGQATWGREFRDGLDRWGLLPASDLGGQVQLSTGFGSWILQVTNGEGWPQSEQGTRKDAELVWAQPFLLDESVAKVQLFYRSGGYEKLGDDNNLKERAGLQAAWESDRWRVGLIAVHLRDSVDAVSLTTGEDVDLSAQGGQVRTAGLQELWFRHEVPAETGRWRGSLRFARLQNNVDDSGKDVKSWVGGFGREWNSGVQIHLLYQEILIGPEHSNLAEDRQRLFLAFSTQLERRPDRSSR